MYKWMRKDGKGIKLSGIRGENIRKRLLPRSNVGGGGVRLQKSVGYIISQCRVDIYLCISS